VYTKQGEPSIRSAANSGASKRPQAQTQSSSSFERSPGMSPAKAYASQQRPSPQRTAANQLPGPTRKEDRHRSMPVQPRANNGSSPRTQATPAPPAPPQASPTPRNKHLSQQAPRDYRDYQPGTQASQVAQQARSNSNVSASSSVPNLAGLGALGRPAGRNIPKINGTYSPVNMVSPSSSPVLGGARSDSARSSPRSSTVLGAPIPGRTPPRSPLTGGDDGASAYDEPSAGPSPAIPSPALAAAETTVWSPALLNGLSQHKRSHDLDPLELSNVNEGLGLDDILQGYNARSSLDSLGLTMSRKPTVEGVTEGPIIENLGETVDRKLSNNSAHDIVTSATEYLAPPEALQVKLRGRPFVGSQSGGGGFTPEDVSPTSMPVPLPLEDDSPRSSESGPPSYQTNSVPASAHGGESPERQPLPRVLTAPSPQSSEKTVQQQDHDQTVSDDVAPAAGDLSADYTDEDMSERAPTPDAVDDDDDHDELPRTDRAGSGQSDAATDEQDPRSLRLASNASSSNKSLQSPIRGQFYHTASSGGRRNSYFNRTVATGYPLRSAMKGGKAQARAAGELPPPPPGSPVRATFRRTVNTKVGNRISRDMSNHRVGADRSSHVAIYQGKVGSVPAPMPEIPSSPMSAYSPRSQGSEDMSRKTSLGLVADGYALIGGALFSVALKPMDERGAAVMKSSAFQNAGQLWTVQPSAAPAHHGTSF
jgi:hypothetical protein